MASQNASAIWSPNASKNSKFQSICDVDLDKSGKFKYILIKVHDPNKDREFKHIVRGYGSCDYHVDIYELCTPDIEDKELDCECVGGGRLIIDTHKKNIVVFGYSQAYGRADHTITMRLLQKKYPNYHISISNEGY